MYPEAALVGQPGGRDPQPHQRVVEDGLDAPGKVLGSRRGHLLVAAEPVGEVGEHPRPGVHRVAPEVGAAQETPLGGRPDAVRAQDVQQVADAAGSPQLRAYVGFGHAGGVEGRPGVHRDRGHRGRAGRVQRPQDRTEVTGQVGERPVGLAQEPAAAGGGVDVCPAVNDHNDGASGRGDHPQSARGFLLGRVGGGHPRDEVAALGGVEGRLHVLFPVEGADTRRVDDDQTAKIVTVIEAGAEHGRGVLGAVAGGPLRAGSDPPPVAVGERFVERALAGQRAAHEDHANGRARPVEPAPAVGEHRGEVVQNRAGACLHGRRQARGRCWRQGSRQGWGPGRRIDSVAGGAVAGGAVTGGAVAGGVRQSAKAVQRCGQVRQLRPHLRGVGPQDFVGRGRQLHPERQLPDSGEIKTGWWHTGDGTRTRAGGVPMFFVKPPEDRGRVTHTRFGGQAALARGGVQRAGW